MKQKIPQRTHEQQNSVTGTTKSAGARGFVPPSSDVHFIIQKKEKNQGQETRLPVPQLHAGTGAHESQATIQQTSQTAPFTGISFAIQKKDTTKGITSHLTSGTAPVQRYAITPEGKLSQKNYLLLRGTTELYATPEKIKEADRIGGQIAFTPGEKKQIGSQSLYKVQPVIKDGTELDTETKKFAKGGNEREQEAGIKKHALEKVPELEDLEEEFKDFIKDHLKEARESPQKSEAIFGVGVNPHNVPELRELKENLAKLAHTIIQTIGVPALERRIDSYIESQARDRPLMPSDCRQMASYVAGFDAGSGGVETDEIAAGNVYEYTTDNQQAEWPFHYAAIIMTDGADHVTMENAAAKASDHFSKKQYDRSWFFEMYGATKGQRFADKYGPDMEKGKEG